MTAGMQMPIIKSSLTILLVLPPPLPGVVADAFAPDVAVAEGASIGKEYAWISVEGEKVVWASLM